MRSTNYFDLPGLSRSDLKEFKRSPEHYVHYKKLGGEPRPHYLFGIAFHALVLEPHKYKDTVYVMDEAKRPVPDKNYQTKVNREWKQAEILKAQEQGKVIITATEEETILRMRDKLYTNDPASEILNYTRNQYEVIKQWKYKGVDCKCMIDIDSDIFISDLKTTMGEFRNSDPDNFVRSLFYEPWYYLQTWYIDGDVEGKMDWNNHKDFYLIAIEKEEPYGVSVVKLRNEVIHKGIRDCRDLVDQWRILKREVPDESEWPSYDFKAPIGGVHEIGLPFNMR